MGKVCQRLLFNHIFVTLITSLLEDALGDTSREKQKDELAVGVLPRSREKNASFSCPSPVGQVVRRVLMLANLNKQIVDRKNLSTWERVLGFKGLCGGQAKGFCFCWQHSEVILIYSWCNFG